MFKRKNVSTVVPMMLILVCASSTGAGGGAPDSRGETIKILYTGQLLGYFRVPDLQSADKIDDCSDIAVDGRIPEDTRSPNDRWSPAAREFEELRQKEPEAILLGMGDNFAPRYEARTFDPKPKPIGGSSQSEYRGKGKDQYLWYPESAEREKLNGKEVPRNTWVYFKDAAKMDKFQSSLEKGNGTIPADNVGCFLKRERYTAIVPGRHDFYFGAQRLRELAGFLSSNIGGYSVKMLGANLVIETTWKSDHKPLPDTEHKWKKYAPHWPTQFRDDKTDEAGGTKKAVKIPALVIPSDGGKVYPWLPGAILKLADLQTTSKLYQQIFEKTAGPPIDGSAFQDVLETVTTSTDAEKKSLDELKAIVRALKEKGDVYLCPSVEARPDDLMLPGDSGCPKRPLEQHVWLDEGAVEYVLEFREPLEANKNYGLCMDEKYLAKDKGGKDIAYYCQRFSVRQPLFYRLPDESKGGWPEPYEPYANVPGDRAVIFGVVDSSVAEYTGALNLQWENTTKPHKKSSYKTTVAIQEAAEAVKEAMLAFDWNYQCKKRARFEGIRILLAQMSPQKAEVLGRRLKRFDVVVTAADEELATGLHRSKMKWTPEESAFPRDYPGIRAVPEPYSVATRIPSDIVQIGSLDMTIPPNFIGDWRVVSKMLAEPADKGKSKEENAKAEEFWKAVAATLQEECGVKAQDAKKATQDNPKEGIQELTLCAIQKEKGADVALLQKRDFYIDFPKGAPDLGQTKDALQMLLDRVIWKGDFLTLLYVPGSALAQAMAQSKKYKADDASALSLSDDRERELVFLGMKDDPDQGGYLIDDMPLDNNRLYAVATSDYIGVGDTGYPDLAAAAVKAPQVPEDFAKGLESISTVACSQIAKHTERNEECQRELDRDAYLDALAIKPVDPRKGLVWWRQLYQWSPFERPHKVPGGEKEPTFTTEAESHVQQRGLGALRINVPSPSLLSVDNASFSLTSVDHKFTDGKLATLFPGSPVPQLTTARGHTFQLDVKPKYSYSWEHLEFFQAQEVRYNVQYTGKANAARIVNQKDNMWSTDTGVAGHLTGRTLPHWEPVFTFHTETQVWNPLPNFLEGLATSGRPNVAQPFDQGRTYLLLPRVGMRRVNRVSWFEVGLEKGGELSVVRLVPNPSNASQTLVQRPNISVSGIYWNWHTVIPFSSTVSWQIDEDGDYRFNNRGDNPIDTRFRSDAETALNFKVWPSLSFAPTYEIFLYSNKVQGIWFWQGQASIKMKTRFDFWNHRKWWTDQVRYAAK